MSEQMYAEEMIGEAVDIAIGDDGHTGDNVIRLLRTIFTKKYKKVMPENEQGSYLYPANMIPDTVDSIVGDDGLRSREVMSLLRHPTALHG